MTSHTKMAASNVRVPDKIMDCDESTSCSDEFEDSCDDSVADKDYALSDNDESSENSEVCIFKVFVACHVLPKNIYFILN